MAEKNFNNIGERVVPGKKRSDLKLIEVRIIVPADVTQGELDCLRQDISENMRHGMLGFVGIDKLRDLTDEEWNRCGGALAPISGEDNPDYPEPGIYEGLDGECVATQLREDMAE